MSEPPGVAHVWHRRSRCLCLVFGYFVSSKVLQALVHAGFVESQKGRGYRLGRELDDISVWELMESVTFNGAPKPEKPAVSNKLYQTLREQVNHWLVGLSVQDIIETMKAGEGRGPAGER